MVRRQPYIEIPYRPADSGAFSAASGSRPYYGSASIPVSRPHPIARAMDEEEAAAAAAAESERIRAMIEAEREKTFAESVRRRAEAEAAARVEADARAEERARAEAEVAEQERIREQVQERIQASRQRALASEDRLSAEAETMHVSAERARAEQEKVHEAEPVWYKGASMAKRIIYAVILIFLVVVGYYWWKQHKVAADIANGEIYSDDLTPGSRTRSGDVTPPIAKPNSSAPVQTITGSDGSTTVIPATDSQSPNAPNGVRFSGTGKYQVYRQGNLTWRVNTETGESCILFATEEEWRKPIVFNHGCNAS